MKMRSCGVKHQRVRAFISHEGLVIAAIFSFTGAFLLGLASHSGSKTAKVISVVLFVVAGAIYVSDFWITVLRRRRSLERESQDDKSNAGGLLKCKQPVNPI